MSNDERATHFECIWDDDVRCWLVVLFIFIELLSNNALTESTLENSNVNGFPIISSDNNKILMGYIGSTELQYVLGECQHLV